LILVRKVGVPFQPELAMGAVVDGGASIIVRNEDVIEHVGIDEDGFKAVCDAEFAEIERRRERYLGNRERAEVAGRTAIVIDDGVAMGATTRAALRATRLRNPNPKVSSYPLELGAVPWACRRCRPGRLAAGILIRRPPGRTT
jgi:putative phosphoribosyl transferase